MQIIRSVSLPELQQHELDCNASVLLGSHGMERYSPLKAFQLYQARLGPQDIDALYLLNCGFTAYTRNESGRLKDLVYEWVQAESKKRLDSFNTPSKNNPVDLRSTPSLALILVSAQAIDGPWVLIDGNHRAMAHYLRHQDVNDVPVYICVQKNISSWPYFPDTSSHWTTDISYLHYLCDRHCCHCLVYQLCRQAFS
ncbi:MAG: hypothetical protein D3923_03585 [Candidatus Electrothrix sp. AR3]|nr:hypothetical protein [Candidatus Electrothrix sp. AR3]